MTSLSVLIERTAGPLDDFRRAWLGLALRSRTMAWFLVRRERRLATFALLHGTGAFILAVYMPLLPFVLGPIVLGVPHVAADLRYLVLRRELARWWRNVIFVACGCLIAVAAAHEARALRGAFATRIETAIVVAWAAVGVLAGATESQRWRRAIVGCALVGLVGAVAFRWPDWWRLAFLHGHNLVALVVWALLSRGRGRVIWLSGLLAIGGAGLLASGALYRVSLESGAASFQGLHVLQAADWVTPPTLRADYAVGLTSAYVFLQSIHYLIWLYFIPQSDARGQGTLTFRMTARSAHTDFGAIGTVLVLLAAVTVAGGAFLQVHRTRALYLSLAMFHGYLELVFIAYFWVRTPMARSTGPGPGG